jgi:hypothetical protein
MPHPTPSKTCPHCNLADRTQHSARRSGQCDGIRGGFLHITSESPFRVEKTGKERATKKA